jgi:hypothetical protein
MELGYCPRCGRAYSVSDVSGFGILRPRRARAGGPRVEYGCPCGEVIALVPHGDGRFARPGEPPPPAPSEAARRPPWISAEAGPPASAPAGAAETAKAKGPPEPPPAGGDASTETVGEGEKHAALGLAEALEVLGCGPAAGRKEIERAFKERSRTCHPDKVAHLDPEFRDLAEKKFKRLRRAYDFLT